MQSPNFDQVLQNKFYNEINTNKENEINPDNVFTQNNQDMSGSENTNISEIDYIIDFKEEEISIKLNCENPSLALYKKTFEEYITDTEFYFKNKFRKNKTKIKNMETKIELIRAKMIAKLVNESFETKNFLLDKLNSLNYLNQKVDTQVKLILKVNIPANEIKNLTRFKNIDKYHSIDEDDNQLTGKILYLFIYLLEFQSVHSSYVFENDEDAKLNVKNEEENSLKNPEDEAIGKFKIFENFFILKILKKIEEAQEKTKNQ